MKPSALILLAGLIAAATLCLAQEEAVAPAELAELQDRLDSVAEEDVAQMGLDSVDRGEKEEKKCWFKYTKCCTIPYYKTFCKNVGYECYEKGYKTVAYECFEKAYKKVAYECYEKGYKKVAYKCYDEGHKLVKYKCGGHEKDDYGKGGYGKDDYGKDGFKQAISEIEDEQEISPEDPNFSIAESVGLTEEELANPSRYKICTKKVPYKHAKECYKKVEIKVPKKCYKKVEYKKPKKCYKKVEIKVPKKCYKKVCDKKTFYKKWCGKTETHYPKKK
eukprot:CAMPEP_0174885228 /NCGR_PEP_ID=MMETSP0167-20121228/551_1 /TAXON_ID=38298 /ORGANISM="Rhodella maculata, Strain CCMP736" /LENGTH=275 /DNA_ID=CAMNT_0016120743 /DNA_START=1364 /DNA_END=2191 /DNA_ORIENTATION=-